jgi:hypothetical protein
MGLINQIKRELYEKEKRPYRPSAFSVVRAVAEKYPQVERFFEMPGSPPRIDSLNSSIHVPLKVKEKLEVPPFGFADRAQYLLIMKILDRFDNPYLPFARSPDEIALSKQLYFLNPSIRSDLLDRRHFESLVLVEMARKRIEALSSVVKNMTDNGNRNGEPAEGEATRLQIKSLKEFIALVDSLDR